jgi:hypothetical protein
MKKAKTDKEIIFLVEESMDGGYEARALGYSIYTEAESLPKLKQSMKDAVRCHFAEKDAPHLIRIHMVKDEVILV